jgi:hypothetical protein
MALDRTTAAHPHADDRFPDPPSGSAHRPGSGHGLLREGLVTGLLGAAAVALWFLLVDLLQGRPLHTPALLGAIVTGSADPSLVAGGERRLALTALYTALHVLAFAAVGVVAVFLVHRAQRTPALVGLLLMLFAATEVAVVGVIALLDVHALGSLAWYQVAVGNLLAALAMGTYLVRRHAGLGADFGRALADAG